MRKNEGMKGLVDLGKYGFVIDNSKRDYTNAKRMFARKSVAEALVKARNFLPKDYNFKIFSGKRSLAEQRKIVQICAKDFKNRDPKNWRKMLVDFTGGYEILKQKRFSLYSHLGAGAVDLTIVNEKGKELDMGGDTFDEREALNFYERKKNLTKREKDIRENRRLLKKVLRKAGFKSYSKEWTHWGFGK